MSTLQEKMAWFGFESNDDYSYQLRALLNKSGKGLRCLNIEGRSPRRKTAFASALAQALEFEHVLYYDFTQHDDPSPLVTLPDNEDEEGISEPPVGAFDRAVSEACAYSEAAKTVLIIDQLQAANFREHIRLYDFSVSCHWTYSLATLRANPKNLLLFLISEEPLYHSLQKASFRVWTEDSRAHHPIDPQEFDLGEDALPMMNALSELFRILGITPTQSELERIIHDMLTIARTEHLLRHSIYGWTEGVNRDALFSHEITPALTSVIQAIEQYVGLDEIQLDAATIESAD